VENNIMVDLSSIFLFCVSSFHIHIGLGNLFKLPPLYDFFAPSWLVNGKPGTGSTEIEKLLGFVFGLWYTGSIAGVLLMFFCGSSAALCGALICPLYYHITVTITAFLYFDKYKIPNPAKFSGLSIALIHAVVSIMFAYVFYMSQ
jgi:hypothetical protein